MNLTKTLRTIRSTRSDRVAAGIRMFIGILFIMTGVMKLVVPSLGAAFAGQLAGANIPLQELNLWVVPFVEVGVGAVLLIGYYTRIATLLAYNIMFVATYVHVVVDDPLVFPLQPEEPIIPAVVMILAAYLLLRGGGAGSWDLKT
jgi:putative oxidoreductase